MALGDGLSLWDVATQSCVATHASTSSTLVAMAASQLPCSTWMPAATRPAYDSGGSRDDSVMFVASQAGLMCIDFRQGNWAVMCDTAGYLCIGPIEKMLFVTSACAQRPGAAARVEQKRASLSDTCAASQAF